MQICNIVSCNPIYKRCLQSVREHRPIPLGGYRVSIHYKSKTRGGTTVTVHQYLPLRPAMIQKTLHVREVSRNNVASIYLPSSDLNIVKLKDFFVN